MVASTGDEARLPSHPGPPAFLRDPRGRIATVVALLSVVVFYVFATHGTFNPLYQQVQAGFAGDFFLAQANSLVHGHLSVQPAQIPGECWFYRGQCYGYYGLTPSLLRVPLLPLLNHGGNSLTAVYLTLALTFAAVSALAIALHVLAPLPRTPVTNCLFAVVALSLTPASVLMASARPAVYEEAIAWSLGFGVFAIYCFLRWWDARRWRWGVLVVLSLLLSTNARPTTMPLAVMLGVGMLAGALLKHRQEAVRTILLAVPVAVLPIVGCLGVYWLKFDSPNPSLLLNENVSGPLASPWWLAARRLDHGQLNGLRYIPTSLIADLRPDGVAFSPAFPFVNFRVEPIAHPILIGIPSGGMYISPFAPVTDDMPLAFVILIGALLYAELARRRRDISLRAAVGMLLRSPLTYATVGAAASCLVTFSSGALTQRYIGDFFPLMVLVIVGGGRVLAPWTLKLSRPIAASVIGATAVVVAWSLFANIALEYQSWWHTTA